MNLTDAYFFVEMCEEKFDLIAMDVFIDSEIPSEFEEVEFLENLKRLLKKDGILMYNRLSLDESDKKKTLAFFDNEFKAAFPQARYLDVGGNYMLLNI